ncbi:MAG: hypothetical protein AAGG56_18600 [Pseudomonadota bacterium]
MCNAVLKDSAFGAWQTFEGVITARAGSYFAVLTEKNGETAISLSLTLPLMGNLVLTGFLSAQQLPLVTNSMCVSPIVLIRARDPRRLNEDVLGLAQDNPTAICAALGASGYQDRNIPEIAAALNHVLHSDLSFGDFGRAELFTRSVGGPLSGIADLALTGATEMDPEVPIKPAQPETERPEFHEPPANDHSAGKPSIVVLPFSNATDSRNYDFFSAGIRDDIADLVGRHRWLRTVPRNALSDPKHRTSSIQQIGETLNVRYIVEGTVRASDDQIRIAAWLSDTRTGEQTWSHQYNENAKDIQVVQTSVATRVAAGVETAITRNETRRSQRKSNQKLDLWDHYHRGVGHLYQFDVKGLVEAEREFKTALEIDPYFVAASARLAYVFLLKWYHFDANDRWYHIEEAVKLALLSIRLDDEEALGYLALGRGYALQGRYDVAYAALNRAISLNPSFAQPRIALDIVLSTDGRHRDACDALEEAGQLNPDDPHNYSIPRFLSFACVALGDLDTAEKYSRNAMGFASDSHLVHVARVAVLGQRQKSSELQCASQALLSIKPDYSIRTAAVDFGAMRDQNLKKKLLDGVRNAGIPEE